jgi:hypothetical protein
MLLRLRQGVTLHRAPISGAFVVDRSRLAAVEITEALTAVLTAPRPQLSAELPPAAADDIRRGVADGWLIVEEAP